MTYQFTGNHYISSLYGVKNIADVDNLRNVFEVAIINAGATIVGKTEKIFEDGGFTCVWLLQESHCSIHTYIEQQNIFVDFFTCGDSTNLREFQDVISSLLMFERSESQRIIRN